MNRIIKATLSNLYMVICIVLVVIGIAALVMTVAGIRPFVIISESMHPEVPKGSLVLLDTSASLDSVKTGDYVACGTSCR